ncbi:MAG TPA: circadian clock KaiB family protein [Chthoniobacteraceae bacterium]|nr:circadian clock KaiB family protein [Chthoniobacteraceae bacterium]
MKARKAHAGGAGRKLGDILKRSADGKYVLRLYITGSTLRSTEAITNLRSLCEEFLPGRYDLEVIDIYQQPAIAGREQIIAAPTLVKQLPLPPRRLIGNLSDRDKMILALNLVKEDGDTTHKSRTRWIKL